MEKNVHSSFRCLQDNPHPRLSPWGSMGFGIALSVSLGKKGSANRLLDDVGFKKGNKDSSSNSLFLVANIH